LDETALHAAIRNLDPSPIAAWIGGADFDEDARLSLLSRLIRSSSLVNARLSAAKATRRLGFRTTIGNALNARGQGERAAFEIVMDQLSLAEEGYRRILAALAASDYAKLDPATRIWAALYRTVGDAVSTRVQLREHLAAQKVVMAQSLSLRDNLGRPVSVDALTDAYVHSAGASLNIEARTHDWVDASGTIVIPARVVPSDEARTLAGANQYLSVAWRNWNTLEERVRFLGGHLRHRVRPDLPETFPDEADELIEAVGTSDQFDIWVGQHRLNDSSAQTYLSILNAPELIARTVPFNKGAALPPKAFISHEEAVAFATLHGNLGPAIMSPAMQVSGLTVPEWLRGFAVLATLVSKPLEDALEDVELWLPQFECFELLNHLTLNGFGLNKAKTFLDEVRFGTRSTDLYDAPLIACEDGRLAAFGPALYGPNFSGILLSIFASRGAAFDTKGPDFEDKVLGVLADAGLKAKGYKTSRPHADTGLADEYEFDGLMLWGNHLFVIECKNRSLPKDSPVLAYNFLRETRKQIRQVQRLCDAIRRWPEIVDKALGEPLGDRTIVPVILNNLPYARSGPTDGVYFYDFQALNRFFDSRALGMSSGRSNQPDVGNRLDIVKIWAGTKPTAEDLMAQLEEPAQLRVNRALATSSLLTFQLDSKTFAAEPRLYREDMNSEIAADLAGVPRHVMKARERKLLKRSNKLARKAKNLKGRSSN